MDKELRKCYQKLDLPYDATEEQVELRKKVLIKIYSAKANDKNISTEKEIEEVEISASLILENIKKNGVFKEEHHKFKASNESLIGIAIVFIFVAIICIFSFYI